MPRKKKKKASWKSPKVRKKVHKLAGRIQKQIGKTLNFHMDPSISAESAFTGSRRILHTSTISKYLAQGES